MCWTFPSPLLPSECHLKETIIKGALWQQMTGGSTSLSDVDSDAAAALQEALLNGIDPELSRMACLASPLPHEPSILDLLPSNLPSG